MHTLASKKRILILGGGFGGVSTAYHLERLTRGRTDVEIVLVSRDNFILMTPLLFEVFSGTLDLRDCSLPVRAFLRSTRFIEAGVTEVDLDRRAARVAAAGQHTELRYDHLILALGSRTNRTKLTGSEYAFTFKTLADALILRSHVIERFERADVESNTLRKRQLLTFVVIGGGLVGVELLGELTAFVDGIVPFYQNVNREEVRFVLLQGANRLMPEIDSKLSDYGASILAGRRGVELRVSSPVRAIESGCVHLADETIFTGTVILTAGTSPNPLLASLPLEKDKSGRIVVEPTMQCCNYPEVWALGDGASIPSPDGHPYPGLAQHALRQAAVLARNIVGSMDGQPPRRLVYQPLGVMASLGNGTGFGRLLGISIRGFPAWFMRRAYYLMQIPGLSRRLRTVIDWTFALLFRPDIVKVSLDSESAMKLNEVVLDDPHAQSQNGRGGTATGLSDSSKSAALQVMTR